MIQQAKAKIFLADQRGSDETGTFQSRYTFNFGKYFNEHKQGFGDIYILNDDILAGGGRLEMTVKEQSQIIFIPVAGAISYKDNTGATNLVAAGQVQVVMACAGTTIEIINPFKDNPVNFLQVWIRAAEPNPQHIAHLYTYDDVNANINMLVKTVTAPADTRPLPFILSIGKFSGRGETSYIAQNKNAGVFVFVLAGAFETEGRLLHARDGLALWDAAAVEMEALSNDAILILIELPDYSSLQ